MIKVLAQMKNLRRGHDTQGTLKKINIDQTFEGYANFMAPDRMEKIRSAVEEKADPQAGNRIFDEGILKPRTETYLTPEWDEMIPFPTSKFSLFVTLCFVFFFQRSPRLSLTIYAFKTAWKVRFNGYGPSEYDYDSLVKRRIPDNPLYQPQGASHHGGSFADSACGCGKACECSDMTKRVDGKEKMHGRSQEALEPAVGVRLVKGCGMPGP